MNRSSEVIRSLRWCSLPLGLIMFLVTRWSFGLVPGLCLGWAAFLLFWLITIRESQRLEDFNLANDLTDFILMRYGLNHLVEIKRWNRDIVVRLYVLHGGERLGEIKKTVAKRLFDQGYRGRILALQVADLDSSKDFPEQQRQMNRQLNKMMTGAKLELLRKKKSGEGTSERDGREN